jgi:cyclophilin family peptidyl-prolyl cis-trans isomerase/FKBP-type peptidyl-prolyl cis-trans isomerase
MPRSRRRLAVVLTVGALLVAACGDDTTEPVAAPPDTNVDTTTDAFGTTDTTADATADDTVATPATAPGTPETGEDALARRKPEVNLPAESPTELVITELIPGTGEPAEAGDTVEFNYVGVLTADGTEFDSSYDNGAPLSFVVGLGQAIPGFDQGLLGVQEGTRRQFDIPASLAYGDQGIDGIIPGGAAITFVVDILSITKPPPPATLAPQADAADCPAPDGSSPKQQEFDEYPPTCIDVTKTYTATVVTNFGEFTMQLDPVRAPLTVNSFVTLARYHYFDDTECHRAMPSFVVQCGDPTATGTGGPGYRFPDELPLSGEYQLGSLAMANSGPDTNGSQFFIITGDNGIALPPNYSLFGQVTDGLDTTVMAMDAVANPGSNGVPPLEQILIESVTITES